jgi:hypothetical protein
VRLEVQSLDGGKLVSWDIECHSVGILSRANLDAKALKVGDKVKVAGNPSRVAPTRMFGTHLLTGSGRELVMQPGAKPYFQTSAAAIDFPGREKSAVQPPTLGLFKVWGSSFDNSEATPFALWSGAMALTPTAKKALAAWNPLKGDTVARGCEPKGMPTIMEQPYGVQFEDRGKTVLLRLEEYDTVRTIHMSDGTSAPAAKSLLGYSVGKWDGGTLVVTTTGISWPYIAPNGLPQGPSSRLEERFTPAADGKRLAYTLTITDPDTFTTPPVLKRAWVWRASEQLRRYACGTKQSVTQ